MSKTHTIVRMDSERALERSTANGWEPVDLAKRATVASDGSHEIDPDNPPLTDADFNRMKRVPRAKTIRRALMLTQEEFAARYHIPIGTLRDWEQGRTEPDAPAQAYLKVIAADPKGVEEKLGAKISRIG
jgi:putative transcriptional regulator